jgi:succinoglycan biosynthesis transport protein ExoP
MDFNQFLLALRARRKAFALVLIATIVTAIAVALVVPKRFVSTATILVDARDEQSLTAGRLSPRERAGYMATQVDLIQSGRVATRVARDLKLAQKPGTREAYEADTGGIGTIDEWIGQQLLEKLKVDTSAGNIITVTFTSSDARKSAEVANGFAKAYTDTALELRTEPTREAAAWFEDQLKGLRANMGHAQQKLSVYQREKGIVSVDERGDIDVTRLTEINAQLMRARDATYDVATRARQANELLASGNVDAIPEVLANAFVNGIKGELQRAEARLQEADAVFGPNHPGYQRVATEVQGLREKLIAETRKVIKGLEHTAAQSRKREDELQNALAAQQDRILRMKDYRIELAALTREVDSAQRTYDAALARYMTNKVESRAQQTNVALLTPAIEPVRPAHPKMGLISALSIIVGGLLAGGVVYILETIDRRVRSRTDLESRLAVPSLGRLSKWQPTGARLLPAPAGAAARALPQPW